MGQHSVLWQPIELGPVSVKNRVVVTAHALMYGDEHNLMTQLSNDEEPARGGSGLILTEAQAVHPTNSGLGLRTHQGWPTEVSPSGRVAAAVHRHGAKNLVELSHFGVADYNGMLIDNWRALWSSSGLPSTTYGEIGKAIPETTSTTRRWLRAASSLPYTVPTSRFNGLVTDKQIAYYADRAVGVWASSWATLPPGTGRNRGGQNYAFFPRRWPGIAGSPGLFTPMVGRSALWCHRSPLG